LHLNLNKPKTFCFGKLFLCFFWLPTTVIYENPVDAAMGLGRPAFLSWAQDDSTNKDQARPDRRESKILIQVGVN
jgi:hypothetical protein